MITAHLVAEHLHVFVSRLQQGPDEPMSSDDLVQLEEQIGQGLADLCQQRQREEAAEDRSYGWGV